MTGTPTIIRYNDKNHYLHELIKERDLHKHKQAIWKRIKSGWSVKRAIETPIRFIQTK
jgi:hypothetical protein